MAAATAVLLSLSGCENPIDIALDYLLIDLEWFGNADLDLSVLDPDVEELSFGSVSASGGKHSGDAQATGYGREFVEWTYGAPAGVYHVTIKNYSSQPVEYDLELRTNDGSEDHSGTIAGGQTITPLSLMVSDGEVVAMTGGGGGNGGSGGGSGGGLTSSAACLAHWRPILVGNGPNWRLSRLVWEGTDHYAPRDYASQNFLRFGTGSANRWTYEVMTGSVRQFNENSEYSITYDPSYRSGVPCVLNYYNQLGNSDKFALHSYSGGQIRLQWSSGQNGVLADWYWVRN